jgi:dynein heavy chain, axonemal
MKMFKDMVRNAFGEMRRYYSRKVVDVIIKVTRQSLDALKKRFTFDSDKSEGLSLQNFSSFDLSQTSFSETIKLPVFILQATLMIPNVSVRPNVDEIQETLIAAGKAITGVAKGVAQWTGGKVPQVNIAIFIHNTIS